MRAWLRIPLQLVTLGLMAATAGVSVVAGAYIYVEPSLPQASELRDVRFQTPLSVYSRDGRLITQFGEQLRTPARFEDIPLKLRQAIIAAEDDRFYEHSGIDIFSTIRAGLNYGIQFLTNSSDRVPGGSTITQQITRTTDLLPRDYALGRKVSEIFLAFRIEREFTKDEILGLYLNTYFFGQRSFGVVTAARSYFDKELDDLTLSEAAIIAGIPTAPSRNNPYYSPANAAARRAYVLRRMHELGYISTAERAAALEEPIVSQLFGVEIELSAGYVGDMAYQWCQSRFGKLTCDTTGLKITTTIDSRLQRAANQALRDGLVTYDHNHGYRGPIARVDFEALGLSGENEDSDAGASPTTMLDTLLADYPDLYGTETAIVLSVNDAYADVYFRNRGLVSVGFDAVGWAYDFISDTRQGSNPKTVADVLDAGDVVRFERLDDGSVELAQIPDIQGALVSLDPFDGAVAALTGGFSFQQTAFNRASQALRQPGSAFKPFFYLSALEQGYTLASIVNDAPLVECSESLERCRPVVNYEGVYHGEVPLREAFRESWNAAADRVIRDIGARYTADYVERFGFNPRPEDRNASLALGSISITPLALANGYAILANGGYAVGIRPEPESPPEPYFIQRVEDAQGNVLYDASLSVEYVCREPEITAELPESGPSKPHLIERRSDIYPPLRCAERVESPQRIYLITDVLRQVVSQGTGVRAGRAFPNRTDLRGKTGTTNDARDAWFAGFNADIVAVARVGFDDDTRPLGSNKITGSEQGGRTAIPIWIDYMRAALEGMPQHSLPRPAGIVERRVNPASGLVAAGCNRDAEFELFVIDNVPAQESDTTCFSGEPQPTGPDRGQSSQSLFN
jgi:penicillin-binding protein 1A